jgi:hypothetical protein
MLVPLEIWAPMHPFGYGLKHSSSGVVVRAGAKIKSVPGPSNLSFGSNPFCLSAALLKSLNSSSGFASPIAPPNSFDAKISSVLVYICCFAIEVLL